MRPEQAISIIVGVVLSLVLQSVPPVKRMWERQPGKVLILLLVHIGGAVTLWLLDCKANINTGVTGIVCNWEGLGQMGWAGTLGFVGNQVTYGLQSYAVPPVRDYIQKVRGQE